MKTRYKTPWHVRQFVKQELLDYKSNKRLMSKYTGSTHDLLLINTRINQIDNVLNRLSKEDREAAEIIFFDKYSQSSAEISKGISKAAYYNAMNKIIYLVAKEMDLI